MHFFLYPRSVLITALFFCSQPESKNINILISVSEFTDTLRIQLCIPHVSMIIRWFALITSSEKHSGTIVIWWFIQICKPVTVKGNLSIRKYFVKWPNHCQPTYLVGWIFLYVVAKCDFVFQRDNMRQ